MTIMPRPIPSKGLYVRIYINIYIYAETKVSQRIYDEVADERLCLWMSGCRSINSPINVQAVSTARLWRRCIRKP